MITNGSILRIDRTSGADATGEKSFTTGADLTALPSGPPQCMLDEVSSSQRWNLGATIKDAAQVCYVGKDDLAAAGEDPSALGDHLLVQQDGDAAYIGEIVVIKNRELSDLSHFEFYLKKV